MKLCVLLVLYCSSSLLAAEVYKWVDDTGAVYFSDKKVHSGALEISLEGELRLDKNVGEKSEDELSREEKRRRLLDALQEDREERIRKNEAELKKLKYKKERCVQLRDNLRNIKRAAGVYKLDENGNRKFISSEQKNSAENNILKTINKYCR